jgi:hypothetical protein
VIKNLIGVFLILTLISVKFNLIEKTVELVKESLCATQSNQDFTNTSTENESETNEIDHFIICPSMLVFTHTVTQSIAVMPTLEVRLLNTSLNSPPPEC